MTDVVAALIWNGNRFLACQRPAHKARGLLWEFVGGKVEPGETKAEALIRECREELDVQISVEELFMEVIHPYPDLTVRLSLYNASIISGNPKKLEHQDIRWITTGEIPQYAFCPADQEILEALLKLDDALQAKLFSLRDSNYADFNRKLIPTEAPDRVLGVRIPQLRKLAKQITLHDLSPLPHHYLEEDLLHGILISSLKDPDQVLCELECFLPFISNWAVCDIISPSVLKRCPDKALHFIQSWISRDHGYSVRFGISMLMKYFSDDLFLPEYADMVASINRNDYYVNMMIAWYFATLLVKQPPFALKILEEKKLSPWVHNKTIQKAIESFRISSEMKNHLRTIKIDREE